MDYEKNANVATEVVTDFSLSTGDVILAPKVFTPEIVSDSAEKSPLIHFPRLKKKKKKVPFSFLESLDGSGIGEQCSPSDLQPKNNLVNSDRGFHQDLACGNTETIINSSESHISGEFSQMTLQSDLSKESKYLDIDMNFEGAKKKKKKSTKLSKQDATESYISSATVLDKQLFIVDNMCGVREYDYTYDHLLTRFYHIAKQDRPSLEIASSMKVTIKPPQVFRIGSKRTSFANIIDICRILHRAPRHLMTFVLTELGTSGSFDGNNQLIIKGRFQQKQIESVIRRYIKEYVRCLTCNSTNTVLQKEVRLTFLMCENCESRRSVAGIKSGFQAVTDKRAAMRAKAVH